MGSCALLWLLQCNREVSWFSEVLFTRNYNILSFFWDVSIVIISSHYDHQRWFSFELFCYQLKKSPIMSVLKAALLMILIIIVNGGRILIIVERGEIWLLIFVLEIWAEPDLSLLCLLLWEVGWFYRRASLAVMHGTDKRLILNLWKSNHHIPMCAGNWYDAVLFHF